MAFDWNLVMGNPFWLGSIPFSLLGWIIAFIGQCVIDRNPLSWWAIVYNLFVIAGVCMVVATDTIRQYRIIVVAFIVLAMSYSTTEITVAFNFTRVSPPFAAIAAGYIFMMIVMILWVFAFGSSDDSDIFVQLNSFSIAAKPNQQTLPIVNNVHTNNSQYNNSQQGIPMGGYASPQPSAGYEQQNATNAPVSHNEYAFRAKALYAYEANQEDPNELSFAKGDFLDIVDNKGKWWQARKEDGTTGIAPSNYLQII